MDHSILKILVPLDGSEASEAVLPAVKALERIDHPEVVLLYVFDGRETHFLPPEPFSHAWAKLRWDGVDAWMTVRDGSPAGEILEAARSMKADLIAMSTHGRGGLKRLLAGSVAESVLRRTELPLLMTRPGTAARNWTRIAVALDGSEQAEAILPETVRIARALGSTVDLIRVTQPQVAAVAGEVPIVLPAEDPTPYLKGVVRRLEAQGVRAAITVLEGGAAEEILGHVERSGVSLITMTTRGRNGLTRLFLGSVAEEVLRRATCPVLLRRTADRRAAAESLSSPLVVAG
ncbi:MAG: universal stress protein [Planctomycetaceae bacterium]|nr:universal stress protein [Planctomycetaceae bacterium]